MQWQGWMAGSFYFCNKYFDCGPRLPNTSMVVRMPVLQHGHLRSSVFLGKGFLTTLSTVCNACSLPRFHVLLTIL